MKLKNKSSMKGINNVNKYGYLFILPFLIVFIVFSIYPILRTLYLEHYFIYRI